MRTTRTQRRASDGFTLVEILVVIGLLGLLFVVLLPQITRGQEEGKVAECRARIHLLEAQARAYDNQYGDWPPDDFKDRSLEPIKLPADNGTNTGIESCLVFVNRSDARQAGINEREEWFGNTDDDRADRILGKLDRKERVELIDPWGNPIAYFHWRGFGTEQNYRMGFEDTDDSEQPVQARKTRDGRYFKTRSFQIFSAGPDGIFGNGDDVANFEIPPEEGDGGD